MKIGTLTYLQCYLDWLSDKFTIKEIAEKIGKSPNSTHTYIKYGRNIAITKYNKQFVRASLIKDEKQRNKVFDEDLKKHLYPSREKFTWHKKYTTFNY